MKTMQWLYLLIGGEVGFLIGVYVGTALEHLTKR